MPPTQQSALEEATEIISPAVRLPDYFPSVLPPCKEVSAEFFYCFSSNSKDNRMVRELCC